jgi:hypothetical protein
MDTQAHLSRPSLPSIGLTPIVRPIVADVDEAARTVARPGEDAGLLSDDDLDYVVGGLARVRYDDA